MGLKTVGDEVEKRCTSTFRCCCDGGSQKSFVVELAVIALVKLEDAVLAHHVGGTGVGRAGTGNGIDLGVAPSWVGMQARQGLLHQWTQQRVAEFFTVDLMVAVKPFDFSKW